VYALRRILAYGIDMGLVLTPVGLAADPLTAKLADSLPAVWVAYSGFLAWVVAAGLPVLLVGVCVGLTGWTPGKLAMFLRVKDRHGRRPGVQNALLREVAKAVSLAFICGAFYAIYGLISRGRTFYDDWLGLEVDDLWEGGLTDVQKNWRRQMKAAQRQRSS
jgi:hypothetical protein